jgi:DNA invertase Pin-like site-specific DNA recombinase
MTISGKSKRRRGVVRTDDVSTEIASDQPNRLPALIGYARVSTDDQNLALQRDALRGAGCGQLFEYQGVSGKERTRPGLDAALDELAPGDVLVVWRLDRLGRSIAHLLALIDDLAARGIGFRSLSESFNARTSGGRLVFHLMAALAEFERALIGERTRAGLAAARARGRRLGRPPRHTENQKRAALRSVRNGRSVKEVAKSHGMHPRTLYRIIAASDGR